MTQTDQVLAEVAGRKITCDDVINRLKFSGAWHDALGELGDEAVVAQSAAQEGLSVTDGELQQDFDDFRRDLGLHKAEDTNRWIDSIGLTVEDAESALEAVHLQSKLAERLIGDETVESYYNQNPEQFAFARISHIVVKDEGAAKELAISARDEGEDFAGLAREHSIDDEETRSGGGFIGLITQADTGELPEQVADRIFSASAGEVLGPFELDDAHCLVRVEEIGREQLDDETRADVRDRLFGEWLGEKAGGNGADQ